MCENRLIVERITNRPIEIEPVAHKVSYIGNGVESILLDGVQMKGIINYAAVYDVKDSYGVKNGYMIIIGERDDGKE